jgi:hypothetical protein
LLGFVFSAVCEIINRSHHLFRTKRQRPRKNSKDALNNSKCSVENNRNAPPPVEWVVEEEAATWAEVFLATRQFPVTRPRTFRLLLPGTRHHLPLLRHRGLLRSREAV